MTTQDLNKTVIMLIHFIVMNNAGGVVVALRNEGYDTRNFIPAGELEAALFQLYLANSTKFFQVMKNIQWNRGHVDTNNTQLINNLIKLTASQSKLPVNNTNWWPTLIQSISI